MACDVPRQQRSLLLSVVPLTFECGGCSKTLRRARSGPAPELCAECRQAANRARAAARRRAAAGPRPTRVKTPPAQRPAGAEHLAHRVTLLRLANVNAASDLRHALDDYLTTGEPPQLTHVVAAALSALDYLDSVPTGRKG